MPCGREQQQPPLQLFQGTLLGNSITRTCRRHRAPWDENLPCRAGWLPAGEPPPAPPPSPCIAGLVGVKIAGQRLNWKWAPTAARSCWGFGFAVTRDSTGTGAWSEWPGSAARAGRDPPPGTLAASQQSRLQEFAGGLLWAMHPSATSVIPIRACEPKGTFWIWIKPPTIMDAAVKKVKIPKPR